MRSTYERTFANSVEGDITKLSFVLDHEIRCAIERSSSMLLQSDQSLNLDEGHCLTYLYNLWMNAVCTTFGCPAAAAAPIAALPLPWSESPFGEVSFSP